MSGNVGKCRHSLWGGTSLIIPGPSVPSLNLNSMFLASLWCVLKVNCLFAPRLIFGPLGSLWDQPGPNITDLMPSSSPKCPVVVVVVVVVVFLENGSKDHSEWPNS